LLGTVPAVVEAEKMQAVIVSINYDTATRVAQ